MTAPVHPSRARRRGLVLALAAASLVAACEDEIPAAQALPERSKPVQLDLGSAAEDSQQVLYVYSPVGKRDPFYNPAAKTGLTAVPARHGGKLTALQKFEIDQLRLQFTMTHTSSPMAMIVDPGTKGHIVRIGDFVGKNWGTVHSITREEIRVVEKIQDQATGRVYPVYIPMRMPKTAADKKAEQELAQEGR